MSESPGKVMTAFVALIAAVVALALSYAVVRGVIEEPSVVGSFATALGAVIAVVVGRDREKRLDLRQKHRDLMRDVYAAVVERVANPAVDEKGPEFFGELKNKMVLNSPAPVIKAWIAWSREVHPELFEAWERVLRAFRADLGHSDSDLGFGDLHRLYLGDADADEFFGPFKS